MNARPISQGNICSIRRRDRGHQPNVRRALKHTARSKQRGHLASAEIGHTGARRTPVPVMGLVRVRARERGADRGDSSRAARMGSSSAGLVARPAVGTTARSYVCIPRAPLPVCGAPAGASSRRGACGWNGKWRKKERTSTHKKIACIVGGRVLKIFKKSNVRPSIGHAVRAEHAHRALFWATGLWER